MNVKIRPTKIRIEASSYCQLRCPSCPTHNKNIRSVVGKGFLKKGDFQKLLDENPWLRIIEISNYGEPFLNPELLEIIKYACKKKVILSADNGVNLNNVKEEILEALVKYRFQSMTCSIDGASDETYRIYRQGGNFETVIENICKINMLKKKYQSKYPYLIWQFIIFGHNEHEIPIARKLSRKLDMKFKLKLSWDSQFSPVCDRELVKRELGVASRAEYKQRHGKNYMWKICHQMWHDPQINWDGKVLGCSRNFWGHFEGNAIRDGLIKSLNTKKIRFARDMILGRTVTRADIPCATCDIYKNMLAVGRFLKKRPAFPYRMIRFLQHFLWKHQI